jgi:hypothetical protein
MMKLHNLLNHGDTLLLLESLSEHGAGLQWSASRTSSKHQTTTTHRLVVWLSDTGGGEFTLEQELDGHGAGDTDQLGHGRGAAVPVSVSLQGGGDGLELSVGSLDLKGVLEEDNVDLALLEGAGLLESGSEGSHNRSSGDDRLGGEETELSELGDDNLGSVGIGESVESSELGNDSAGC